MKIKTFTNLKSLVQYGDKLARTCNTVSFDLFDTLFIRRMHDPDMIKPAVARFIAARAEAFGLKWSWEAVQELRDRFEKRQREETGKQFDDHEARYPDFMREVLTFIFKERMSGQLLDQVTDYELAMESAMIVTRAALADWIKKLHIQGKKILIISDIYQPAANLKRLVETAGLTDYVDDVISSADTFLAKASGKAFPMIRAKYALDVNKWLHIGDNPISDGARPAAFGIRSLIINDTSEKWRKTIFKTYTFFAQRRPYWRGRLLQQLMLPLEDENKPRPHLYIEGYNFLAPVMGAFIQGLIERSKTLGVEKIYFFSREGFIFKQFFERAAPLMASSGLFPPNRYLYVSRLALAGASCAYQGLNLTKSDIAFLPLGNKDMRDLCRVFSLDIKPLIPIMKKHRLKPYTTLSPAHPGWTTEKFYRLRFLLEDQDFQTEVKRQTRPYNDALQQYLEHINFFDQRHVALVDIGWMGTIQRFLYDAVKHREDKPVFHGFLLAASRGVPYPTQPDNTIEGIIYDRKRFDFASSSILYARDIFEEACRAPHPSIIGYKETSDGFRLVFREDRDAYGRAEMIQDEHFYPLRQGLLDAASRYAAASAVMGYGIKDMKPWIRYLLASKLAFPRTKEVKQIKHKYHMDDFSGKHKPPAEVLKVQEHLWDSRIPVLRWNPFIRLQYYLNKQRAL